MKREIIMTFRDIKRVVRIGRKFVYVITFKKKKRKYISKKEKEKYFEHIKKMVEEKWFSKQILEFLKGEKVFCPICNKELNEAYGFVCRLPEFATFLVCKNCYEIIEGLRKKSKKELISQ